VSGCRDSVEIWCRSVEPGLNVSPSHRPSTGSCHRARSGSTQQHVPGNGCHLACIQGVPGGSSGAPALSARARDMSSGCHLCRCRRYRSDVEWQPCHCGRGSGHEQPGECSGDSHDGGWRWGAPLGRVASLVQTGSAHRVGHRLVRLSAAPTLPRWSGACPALKLCFKAWTQGASGSALRALRQLTKVGCGLSELPRGTQIVSLSHAQCDGRITRLKTSQFKTICPTQAHAPNLLPDRYFIYHKSAYTLRRPKKHK